MINKFAKKAALSVGTVGAIAAPIASTISCSLFNKSGSHSDYEFYNYVDYMNENTQTNIEKVFDYAEFGDLPELQQSIRDERVAAGIGSDYFNAMLAGEGLIAKINFAKLYGITSDRTKWSELLGNTTNGIYTSAT